MQYVFHMFFLFLVHPPHFVPPEWSSNAFSLVLEVDQVKLELSKNQLGAQKCKRNSDRLIDLGSIGFHIQFMIGIDRVPTLQTFLFSPGVSARCFWSHAD